MCDGLHTGPLRRTGSPRARCVFFSALLMLFVVLAACSTSAADPTTPSTTPPNSDLPIPSDDPGIVPPVSGAGLDWGDPSATVTLHDGWTVHACLGDAPLMCFDHDGTEVSALEAHPFRLDSFDDLDPDATDTANLQALAAAFLAEFGRDRAAGCGADYGFQAIEPHPMQLGGKRGIGYGFVGTLANGDPSEVQLQYATIRGDQVLLLNAQAYDEAGCLPPFEGIAFTSAQLLDIREDLESLLIDMPLPQLPTPPPVQP